MKKILFTLLILTALICNAKNNTSDTQTTDSIRTKIEQLQDRYNYILCDFELFKLKTELTNFKQDIDIKTNLMLHDVYNGRYNKDLYNAYVKNYDAQCFLFNSMKKETESLREMVYVFMITSNFTDTQLSVIYACFDTIESLFTAIDASLEQCKIALQMYSTSK